MYRSITRAPGGDWAAGPGTTSAHVDRMSSAADRALATKPGADQHHLTYLERHDVNHATLVSTRAYFGAGNSPQKKQAAILYEGPIPTPPPHEVSQALHTLQYAGVSPLSPDKMREAYMTHVIAPLHPPATQEDKAYFRQVLADPQGHGLSANQAALYKARLKAAGG